MAMELEAEVLKGVSRSFYLSLRFLPKPMRGPAGIAYLLARLSDTIADSASVGTAERIEALEDFLSQVMGRAQPTAFPGTLAKGVEHDSERELLGQSTRLIEALKSLSDEEQCLIREVLETIVSGQIFDLERFGEGVDGIRVIGDSAALDDYTWRVAGCVGLFWTRLGFLSMGTHFSQHPQAILETWAVNYGKGLQLVNILRDLPEDLRAGRCYLPVTDVGDAQELLSEFQYWREIAEEKISDGRRYASRLASARLRCASVLPAAIAEETLALLDVTDLTDLEPRIRVPRHRIYLLVLREFTFG